MGFYFMQETQPLGHTACAHSHVHTLMTVRGTRVWETLLGLLGTGFRRAEQLERALMEHTHL